MTYKTFEITIEGDSEGCVTFECPSCESEFKLKADEFQDGDEEITELFCPYCGLVDEVNSFYTKEVIEHANAIAQNYMIEQVNKTFSDIKRSSNRNKSVKISFKKLKKVNLKELKNIDTVEKNFKCSLCDRQEKVLYCAGASKIYCSYCGVDM